MVIKSLKPLGIALLPMLMGATLNAVTVTDPVGVVKITIAAAAAADQPTFSFLSTSMSQEVAYQGTVFSGDTGTITIASDDWTANQFSGVPHYVMVASGAREGELLDIASNTLNTITLSGAAASESQSDLAGETIRIHKHNTIASIFGADPAVDTVQKGNVSTADQILRYNPITSQYEKYYWNNETDPFDPSIISGWVNASNTSVPAGDTVIYPDDGFIYKRVPVSAFNVSVSGQVITNDVRVPIMNGYNLITVPYPIDKNITLATSNLYPANPANFDINLHLKPGSLTSADQVLVFENGTYKKYYYNTETDPFDPSILAGWISASDATTSAASTVLPEGGFFILRRAGSPAFNWTFSNVMD